MQGAFQACFNGASAAGGPNHWHKMPVFCSPKVPPNSSEHLARHIFCEGLRGSPGGGADGVRQ
eukprot:4363637-Lingulodinium_polyedra.AAC.1